MNFISKILENSGVFNVLKLFSHTSRFWPLQIADSVDTKRLTFYVEVSSRLRHNGKSSRKLFSPSDATISQRKECQLIGINYACLTCSPNSEQLQEEVQHLEYSILRKRARSARPVLNPVPNFPQLCYS